MPGSDTCVLGGTATSFRSTYSQPEGSSGGSDSRILPPLSVLSDRTQLRPSRGVDAIASEVEQAGFSIGWNDDRGRFAVSPVSRPQAPDLSATFYTEMPASKKTKMPSFLTFAPKASSKVQRPHTSNGVVGPSRSVELEKTQAAGAAARPSTSTSNTQARPRRFAGLSRSVDLGVEHPICTTSLGNLNAAVASRNRNIPLTNLQALTEPKFHMLSPLGQGRTREPWAGAGTAASFEAEGSDTNQVSDTAAPDHVGTQPESPQALSGPTTKQQQNRMMTPAVQNMSLGVPGETQATGLTSKFKRTQRTHPMAQFSPTRAQALVVFYHLDHDNNGKVTMSELEEACVALGFNAQQSRRLFDKLDAQRKGFITSLDWGCLDFKQMIEVFTLLYMRKFMGLPDTTASDDDVRRYFRAQEVRKVKSLTAAINLVRVNAVSRGARASNNATGNVIYEAFRFLDTDKSGVLTRNELKDGFGILGVQLADNVADEVMDLFDANKSGTVEYYEFVKTLFPKSLR